MDVSFSATDLRIFLHVLAATVWVGGQVLMLGLLPVLRQSDGMPTRAAQAFGRVAWPAFGLAFLTGIWNILALDMAEATTAYNITFGIKFLLVCVSGAAAFVHARTDKASIRGATGGIGFLASLIVLFLGVAISH